MVTRRLIAVSAGLVLTLGLTAAITADTTQPAPAPTFTKDIKPLADAKCRGCHATAMSNYDTLIAKKLVVANKPDDSKYYTKPSGKASHGGGNVWKDKADLVKAWIASGAAK